MSAPDLAYIRVLLAKATTVEEPRFRQTCDCQPCVAARARKEELAEAAAELVKVVPGLLEEVERLTRERDEALADAYDTEKPIATVLPGYMGNAEQWCYFAEEYPDDGSVGPFTSYGEAVEHAMGDGYDVREPAE